MRKYLPFALAAAALLLGATAIYFNTQFRQAQTSNATLQSASRETQEQYARTIDAIAQIQDSLNAITPGDKNVPFESQSLSNERRMGAPSGEIALERIRLLRASIERNRDRIARLEGDLRRGHMRTAGLQKLVASLRQTTVEKEAQIAALSAQVGTLQTQVGGLTTQVSGLTEQVGQVRDSVREREAALTERQHELATIYWVADSKQALTRSGVIEARGGLLGIGKTLRPSARTGDEVFRPLDTDQQTVLALSSSKARVLSAQPLSSYELRLVNGKMELHILSPHEFRKVRQLVIVTA